MGSEMCIRDRSGTISRSRPGTRSGTKPGLTVRTRLGTRSGTSFGRGSRTRFDIRSDARSDAHRREIIVWDCPDCSAYLSSVTYQL